MVDEPKRVLVCGRQHGDGLTSTEHLQVVALCMDVLLMLQIAVLGGQRHNARVNFGTR